jgi:hypothetical protein
MHFLCCYHTKYFQVVFLAPAGVKNYNIVYTMYWLAADGEIICILGHAKCYLDSYGANIAHFAQFDYGKYFWMLFLAPAGAKNYNLVHTSTGYLWLVKKYALWTM